MGMEPPKLRRNALPKFAKRQTCVRCTVLTANHDPPPVAVRSRATRVLGFVDFWGTRDVEIRSSCQIVYVSVFVGLNDPWWCPVVFGLVDIGPWPNTRVSTDQPLLRRTTVTSENR